jgi:hypothetical protein
MPYNKYNFSKTYLNEITHIHLVQKGGKIKYNYTSTPPLGLHGLF